MRYGKSGKMKKENRFLIIILLILSISLGCKLAVPKVTPAAENSSTPKAYPPKPTALPIRTPLPTTAPVLTTTLPASTQAPQSTPYSSPLSAGDPYSPELGNSGYDVQKYLLQLTLNPASNYILAHVTITATATTQIEQIGLDFIGFDIDQVTFLGQPAGYQRQANKLLVDLPVALPPGKEFVLDITYSGEPVIEASAYRPFSAHVGMIRPDNQSLYVDSEPDGSRYWFPCNDHPRDKAAYRFELTVPVGMTGVANGKLIGEPKAILDVFPNGKDGELYIWEHNYPTATAFVTVAVAKYERVDGHSPKGIPLRSYVFPDQKERFQSYETRIGEMIDWLSELFGPYPFDEFGYVMVKGEGASLETQTMVVLDEAMLNEETLVHEMAHMWFGDWVSLDSWGEIWRSEGFATYTQYLWAYRNQPDQIELSIRDIEDFIVANPGGYPLNYPPREEMFGYDSYDKGALVAHALREKMGDQAFYNGLHTYFQRYGGGVASHAQFQAVMEEAGGIKLDEFFANWFK
jgi:aminopeptidase N